MKEETFEKILRAINDVDPDNISRNAIESALRKELDDTEYEYALRALKELMGGITEILENPEKYHLAGSEGTGDDTAPQAEDRTDNKVDDSEGGKQQ